MTPLDRVIIISVSGRALAQSAAKCANEVIVLDAFADRDTQAIAKAFAVNVPGRVSLSKNRCLTTISKTGNRGQTPIVIGGGLESAGSWLHSLSEFGDVIANASLFKEPASPTEALSALSRCGWSVPETQTPRPRKPRGWLQKRTGHSGGVHIRNAESASNGRNAYYQREVMGVPMSVTFLATNNQAHVLGFNRLLTESVDDSPYCYAGVISGVTLPPELRERVRDSVQRMVEAEQLRGLCGVDFILAGDDLVALELNARPTASFELYDDYVTEGLVRWHIESFRSDALQFPKQSASAAQRSHGIQVVYANATLTVSPQFEFPAWACDIPRVGTKIPGGAPLCSVRASGDDARIVAQMLTERAREMRGRIAVALR